MENNHRKFGDTTGKWKQYDSGEEAVEVPSMGKGGGKKRKLAKKKKAKKMEKENDLVGSSQGSDSQLSEAGDK